MFDANFVNAVLTNAARNPPVPGLHPAPDNPIRPLPLLRLAGSNLGPPRPLVQLSRLGLHVPPPRRKSEWDCRFVGSGNFIVAEHSKTARLK
jgi:hypothetical protein